METFYEDAGTGESVSPWLSGGEVATSLPLLFRIPCHTLHVEVDTQILPTTSGREAVVIINPLESVPRRRRNPPHPVSSPSFCGEGLGGLLFAGYLPVIRCWGCLWNIESQGSRDGRALLLLQRG